MEILAAQVCMQRVCTLHACPEIGPRTLDTLSTLMLLAVMVVIVCASASTSCTMLYVVNGLVHSAHNLHAGAAPVPTSTQLAHKVMMRR